MKRSIYGIDILVGDCLETLKALPAESINTCVTSPPYFGLRDYGMVGQIGLEETPEAFVNKLVTVFREVRRVLRDDGTLWLNLGDSYAGSGRGGSVGGKSTLQGGQSTQEQSRIARGSQLDAGLHEGARQSGAVGRAWVPAPPGFKQKDLIGIPWRVAFALQADGWYLRSDIIWNKPNPMPSSVGDRCTTAHEYIFMLSKSAVYYFDADAIAEPVADSTMKRVSQPTLAQQHGSDRANGGAKSNGPMKAVVRKQDQTGNNTYTGFNAHYEAKPMRNKRSVWTVTTKPFKGAHFATFPPDLIEPCVLAGSPMGGSVLDPFGGAGTTGLVAQRYGRRAVLCELNPEYADIAAERIATDEHASAAAMV